MFGFSNSWCGLIQSADEVPKAAGVINGSGTRFLQFQKAHEQFRNALESRKRKFLALQLEKQLKKEEALVQAQLKLLKLFSGGSSESESFARLAGIQAVQRIQQAGSPIEAFEIAAGLNDSGKKGVTDLLYEDITGRSKVFVGDVAVVDTPSKPLMDRNDAMNSSLRAKLAIALGILPPTFLEE